MITTETKTLFNHKMVVVKEDHIGKAIIKNGIYAKQELAYLTALLDRLSPENVLEIGANIGNHALPFSLYAKHVWCFEPNPEVFEILSRNIEINNIGNITAIPAGVSDQDRKTILHVDLSGNLGASTLAAENKFDGVQYKDVSVEIVAGDKWVRNNVPSKIDFVKIDVEGHELNVLRGLKSTLVSQRPIISMEWSQKSTDRGKILESDFLTNELKNYLIFSGYINTKKSLWKHKFLGNIRRIIYKLGHKKSLLLAPFAKDDPVSINAELLIMIPKEKEHLI